MKELMRWNLEKISRRIIRELILMSKKKICSTKGCNVVLSMYNELKKCASCVYTERKKLYGEDIAELLRK